MDYSLVTTAAAFDSDVAARDWPQPAKAAAMAAKSLADLTKAAAVEVAVAFSAAGGWCVVRVAPFNPES